MKKYCFLVKEIVEKYVWVEADNIEEAEELACQEDMDKNFDYYSLEAEYVDEVEV